MENERQDDASIEGCDDAPETPAPLFAVRAFKHAIWGTPKPGETVKRPAQPRRRTWRKDGDSCAETMSAATSNNARRMNSEDATTPLTSPAKRPGILVTPGTGGKGRKTVSFEARQRALQSRMSSTTDSKTDATPKDVPGRFPSPWVSKDQPTAAPAGAGAGVGNVNSIVRDACTSSNSQTQKSDAAVPPNILRPIKSDNEGEFERGEDDDYNNPRSASGIYWKSIHETYARKSEVQMRKVVKKEQIAKKFAKFKDAEASKLSEELEKERRKVALLEAKMLEYVGRLEGAVVNGDRADRDRHDKSERRGHGLVGDMQKVERPPSQIMNESPTGIRIEIERIQAKPSIQSARTTLQNHRTEPRTDRSTNTLTKAKPSSVQNPQGAAKKATREHISSDIWADIGDHPTSKPDPSGPASSHSTERTAQRSSNALRATARNREPLRTTNGNIGEPRSLQGVDKDGAEAKIAKGEDRNGRAEMMSLERREAARKRLAEKKRLRKIGSTGKAGVL